MDISITRAFPCPSCTLAFKSRQFLQRHMISHSDSRDFPCQYCEKSYKYKKGLNRHVQKLHLLSVSETKKQLRKKFKIEDYLDLGNQQIYTPQKIIDSTGKEVEIIFAWRCKGVKLD